MNRADIREAAFWAKVRKGERCWEWTAAKFKAGYGAFGVKRRMGYAHRISYLLCVGDPGDLQVCHKCDNRGCVRPDHLFLGTAADNNKDMRDKHRGVNPPIHKGATHPRAVLTEDAVRRIRKLIAQGLTHKEIARVEGLKSGATISNIRRGLQWRNV